MERPMIPRPPRRAFLTGIAGGAASLWIPKTVKGYTAADMRAVAGSGKTGAPSGALEVGISKWDLDTPALC
ncbi:MAG: hypothetical protein ACRD1H_00340, partial [Vicinamibacterales bacterium]